MSIQFDLSPAECAELPWHDRIAGYAVDVTTDQVSRVASYPVNLPHNVSGFLLAHRNVDELRKLGFAARTRVLYRDGSEEA